MTNVIKKVGVVAPLILILGCGDLKQPSNESVKGGEVVVDFSATMMKKNLISEV